MPRVAWLMACLMACLGALPLLLAWPVPLQDWPNHVAGAHVLAALLDGDPFWSRFYRFNTFLIPNAAVDLGLLGLHRAGLAEPVAANVFLLATYVVFLGGMALLSRALSTLDATRIALAVLVFYGTALFWGLVNYVLAVGLMWGLLGLWIGAGGRPVWRLALAAAGAGGLLFVHAVPAIVFAMLLGCFDAVRWREGAPLRSCVSTPVALGVVVLLLRLLPGNTGHDLSLGYAGADSSAAFAAWKLRILATSLLGGSLLQDGASAVVVVAIAAILGLAARPRLSPACALATASLVLLTLAAPERLGTGSLLDVRLAILPPMLLAASIRLRWRGVAMRAVCAGAVVLLVTTRTAVIAFEWRAAASVFAAYDRAASVLPHGSLMMMAYGTPLERLSWQQVWSPPIQSIATQVVTRGVLFPALFANPDQQPIAARPPFDGLGQPWNLSDKAHRDRSLDALAALCAQPTYRGVFLTVLYDGPAFRILDACARPSP